MHVFPPLLQLWDTLRALWHQDDSRTRCARPPSATSILEMRSGTRHPKPRIRAERPDGWEDVKGVVHHQGLSYVPEVIRTELISRHHDEGTSASIQLKNSLPGNLRETCSCRYRFDNESQLGWDCLCLPIGQQVTTWAGLPMSTDWKDTSHDLGGIAYIYQSEEHELRFASSLSTGQFSGRNYRWILGGIAYVYQLEKHKSRYRRDCLCLPIEKTRATIRSSSSLTGWH